MSDVETGPTAAFMDTTIQIDRWKTAIRKSQCEEKLSTFDETIATGLSLVEFKAVFIQQLITIHNQLRRTGARFTAVRDALVEKSHPQAKLRSHIFSNWLAVNGGSSFEVDQATDENNALKARLKLEDTIPRVYEWFRNESATVFLNKQALACDRAEEKPVKQSRVFAPNLPVCRRGKNKTCRVEKMIREKWPSIQSKLPVLDKDNSDHAQLIKQSAVLDEVCSNDQSQLSVNDCRAAGDSLLAIEVTGIATHALSTNGREWEILSSCAGLSFVPMKYTGEETHS